MKKIQVILCSVVAFVLLCSHDMFIKFDNYFLQPNTQAVLQLFNGTFEKSDNVIDRNRMTDVSLVGSGNRTAVDSTQWFEKDDITFLNFKTGNEGTWVAGLSTAARDIELTAEDFNKYLKSDGVLEILDKRKASKTLNENAVEKYSKHVKAIFQVGNKKTNDYNVNLGYPIEFIPLQNPYNIHPGHNLEVKLLYKGKPLSNHYVYVGKATNSDNKAETHSHDNGEEHSHSHDTSESSEHVHPKTEQFKTNEYGVVSVNINEQGIWYLRTIKMVEVQDENLTHESNWATLTFAIGESHGDEHSHNADDHSHDTEDHVHGEGTHTHDGESDEHEHEDGGFPSYIFWIASIVILALLFFLFNRKK
ncbi:DUF4198 domain-containing protein [Winogradskyella ursingii]|uniref:DUF4198 domain-containing protein n=1 Tax=Winogradskyella ursingii TaxID=2686079 RepID=UPI0015C8489F|nr:DUF4198 domain-containing protein [Winogradskyella ursingii]